MVKSVSSSHMPTNADNNDLNILNHHSIAISLSHGVQLDFSLPSGFTHLTVCIKYTVHNLYLYTSENILKLYKYEPAD